MNINAILPDGPTIAIEHQATGETPVHVTPEGIQPAAQRKPTRGDRLRRMSDEELAEFIIVSFLIASPKKGETYTEIKNNLIAWLKEEDPYA